ncbi:MAG: CDP-diacylglycerol--serine O-phosphatidyltransferase [Kangiellaceae bacterium]|nr:CDP-diacylglycerol--serine O-phosphatidyltransferase [Kangiellaceae bacterium]
MNLTLRPKKRLFLDTLPSIPVSPDAINIIETTLDYRSKLIELINSAKKRIYITALYLQDDEAGREVLNALYQAKQNNPKLEVLVFVDFLRAQRGLMGQAKSVGNVALYRKLDEKYEHPIEIYGVPVKSKEFLGVLHLKGFVFDDTLLYSGSSINNIYLQQSDRYRYDRYHLFDNKALATSFVRFLRDNFVKSNAVQILTNENIPTVKTLKPAIRRLKSNLRRSGYFFKHSEAPAKNGESSKEESSTERSIKLTPLLGFGGRKNLLNKAIFQLISQTVNEVVIFTPYFNFPDKIYRAVRKKLKQKKKVTIVVGDKTANDFYIPEDQPFNKVGILPYIYEASLKRFVKANQTYIDQGLLDVCLWLDPGNSFHLKGVSADQSNYLITGHNINPRAWRLDIENGVLIQDPEKKLQAKFDSELAQIQKHCTRVNHFDEIETPASYREEAQKLLKLAKRAKLDSILNRLL